MANVLYQCPECPRELKGQGFVPHLRGAHSYNLAKARRARAQIGLSSQADGTSESERNDPAPEGKNPPESEGSLSAAPELTVTAERSLEVLEPLAALDYTIQRVADHLETVRQEPTRLEELQTAERILMRQYDILQTARGELAAIEAPEGGNAT